MRDQWNSKLAFILAAIGSAVGLGNLWRFPYIAATNGGGAFMLPYLIAILTAGIPLLILEYTLGKTYKAGAPGAFARINRKFEWLGWVEVLICFTIAVYYMAIVVWTTCFVGFSITQPWKEDANFFYSFLGLTDGITELGGIQTGMIIPFLICWAITGFIMYRGINKGIDIACKICLPILLICTIVLFFRGITLDGAVKGLAYMFTPDWSALTDSNVWVAAYGQVFFSLSICFAIMISYSSYLPEKEDVVNTAFLTACTNHGFEVFAGIGIFAIMGFMATTQGVEVADIAKAGPTLAFVVFPQAIATLPGMQGLFGILFFVSLFTAGLTSLVSILQAVITGVEDKFNLTHKKATTVVLVPAFVISFLFITGAGLYILDLADFIANNIGIAGCGVMEVVLIAWLFKPDELRTIANSTSNFPIGSWWKWSLRIVTLIILGWSFLTTVLKYLTSNYSTDADGNFIPYYEGYPLWCGLIVLGFIVIGAIVLSLMKGKESFYDKPADAPGWSMARFRTRMAVGIIIFIAALITIVEIVLMTVGFGDNISNSAVLLMILVCAALWGGIAAMLVTMRHKNNQRKRGEIE